MQRTGDGGQTNTRPGPEVLASLALRLLSLLEPRACENISSVLFSPPNPIGVNRPNKPGMPSLRQPFSHSEQQEGAVRIYRTSGVLVSDPSPCRQPAKVYGSANRSLPPHFSSPFTPEPIPE